MSDTTHYHNHTPMAVREILETSRVHGLRLRLHYGDTKTGRDWMDEFMVKGTIGRSTGSQKVPLMIANARSMGGPALLDHCIVKITTTVKPKHVLYQHPKYHVGVLTIQESDCPKAPEYRWAVMRDGDEQARFTTKLGATRYVDTFGSDHACVGSNDDGEDLKPDKVTCGICQRSWCERCDPAPSALCHYCHGRGYSDAALRS